jgi:hypothetical protein
MALGAGEPHSDRDLPSGKAIAERFDRRERWGRLVKQAGRIEGWT